MTARRQALVEGAAGEMPIAARQKGGWTFEDSILHPYLGYAREPDEKQRSDLGFHWEPSRSESPETDDRFVVAITGGSVAESFYYHSLDNPQWRAFFEGLPEAQGKSVHFVLLGLRGYKQPQQALAVAYFLALGERLDILINLDGYNEISLASRLREVGVFPGYPFHWRALTADSPAPAILGAIGKLKVYQDLRIELALRAESVRYVISANLLWSIFDRLVAERISRQHRELEGRESEEAGAYPYFRTGPLEAVEEENLYRWSAALWSRGALLLQSLAESHRFLYLHFLQPNQYVPGSKPLSEFEAENSHDEAHPSYRYVTAGYPELQAAGKELAARGAHFYDLTGVFRVTEETVYIDRWCHVNGRGNTILEAAIIERLEEALAAHRHE